MLKPRVIIAETDENFAMSLQIKFIKKFYEYVNLEIITDSSYYAEFFSAPQKIDILIVSELLYDESLSKHNISVLFVMSEKSDLTKTEYSTTNYLYKYTDINQNFEEIVGKSSIVLDKITRKKDEPKIVLCYSASGGVGKTTLAIGVAAKLAKKYKNVLYINATRLQSHSIFLNSNTVISDLSICSALQRPSNEAYSIMKPLIVKDGFSYIPKFKISLLSLGLPYSIYEQIVIGAKTSYDYDYIIVDTDVIFDDYKAKLIGLSDKVILVTEQSTNSILATNALLTNIDDSNKDKYIFICNKYDKSNQKDLIVAPKYIIDDYVEMIDQYEDKNYQDLVGISGISRLAYLL